MSQKEFDFPRAAKLGAIERVKCPGGVNVKSLIKALDGFARNAVNCTVTKRAIAISMGYDITDPDPKVAAKKVASALKAVQRATTTACDHGLLNVYGCPTDGRSNTYQINWQTLFALPDGMDSSRPVKCPGGADIVSRVPGHHVQGGGTPCPGSLDTMSRAVPTDRIVSIYASVRPAKTNSDGGGGFEDQEEKKKSSGWWAWRITRDDLANNDEMVRFFKAAVSASVITDSKLNRVRFVALTIHTQRQEKLENVCGYIVTHIERGSWNYLAKDAVRDAVRKCNIQLTPEELIEVRQAVTPALNSGK